MERLEMKLFSDDYPIEKRVEYCEHQAEGLKQSAEYIYDELQNEDDEALRADLIRRYDAAVEGVPLFEDMAEYYREQL